MNSIRKSKYLRYALMAIAAFVVCLFSAFITLGNNTSRAQDVPPTAQKVYVGDTIAAEDFTIVHDGKQVKAERISVVYPSGGVYGGEKIVIEEAGQYEITYFATVDGASIEKTRSYLALRKAPNVIVAGAGMQVEYGKYELESPYPLTKDTYGAIVSFKAGESITFGTKIKTEKLTSKYNLINMIVMPSVYKETDFERLTLRVADAENPDNYVEIIIDSSNAVDGAGQVSYVRAGANGQQAGGYEGSSFHSMNYGTQVEHSFRGTAFKYNVYVEGEDPRRNPKNQVTNENSLTVAIDNESKKIYCGPANSETTNNSLVNDLDDAAHYKGNPWGGFTSEEVVVTLTAGRFAKVEGKVLIKSFGDYDFSKDIVDELAPEIKVEHADDAKMPVAKVGEHFALFPFTAKDALDSQVKSSVWVYYKDAQGRKITVQNDGESFFVKYAGTYEIVYRVEDYSGNVAEERVEIEAVDNTPNIFIAIEEDLIEKEVYEVVNLPLASQMQAFGGSGNLSVERTVCDPDGNVLSIKNALQLTKLGDYKVIYTVTDYLGTVEHGVITVRSTEIAQPKFIEQPAFDAKLIAGFTYNLPEVLVVETNDGKLEEIVCKTYVNGELKNGSFKAEGTLASIRYVAEGKSGVSEWSEDISVVDTEKGKYKSRYFLNDGEITFNEQEKTYLELLFAEDCATTFVNPLYAGQFALSMVYKAEGIGFESMAVTLTDALDRSKQVTMRFFYDVDEDAWFIQMNDKNQKTAYATSGDIWTLAIAGNTDKVLDASGVTAASIVAYDDGEPFEGFADTVYLSIAFEGVKQDSFVRLTKIGNQSMGHNKSSLEKAKDEIKPIIVFKEALQLRQDLGAKAVIPTAKAYDVLSQIAQFTVTVEIDGQTIASGPATQALDFTLDKAGYYTVTYYVKDSNGNSERVPFVVFVKDETAPTLTVKDSLKDTYKVGDKVTIPKYSATDNGENCYVQVMVIFPDNEMRLLHYVENGEKTSLLDKENDNYGNDFKAGVDAFFVRKKGLYTLRVLAYDEYYNYTVKEITFIVK